ncbi:hypothetical protein [Glycomyces buryatensis]|uniref:Uncharacterized protein n=1 Tax=Glycomyces buryatensis TaxID=2570927 RepID=A0A4S8PZ33_9ACTN|nr:hypothetical protein [Glycomyces buryatensis]THV37003.1 hypothetical protein FAB82_20825 [Glycomyces buryatensis]
MTAPHSSSDLVFRASAATRFGLMAAGGGISVLFMGLAWWQEGWGLAAIMGGCFAAILIPTFIYVRNAYTAVTSTHVGRAGITGRLRAVPRAHIAAAVRARLLQPRTPALDNLFLIDHHGRQLLRLIPHNRNGDQIDQIVALLGVPVTGPDEPVWGKQLAREYPVDLALYERRPYLFSLSIAGVTCVVIFAVIVAVVWSAS